MKPTIASLLFLIVSTALLSNCSSPSSPTPSADVTINVLGQLGASSFSPNPATVTAGQTVSWRNSDGTVHRMVQDTTGFDSLDISGGATTTPLTLSTRGTITYHCSIHPTMTGMLVVQ